MNLLKLNDQNLVSKTNLSRKLTIGGVTKAYPVYRVKLDLLFYNDQNDRIATWITQYRNDENNTDFSELDREQYNGIIERFIIDSNPAAIEKTKNNIELVKQREPGTVLADGRIIDGNRRFTCLRLLKAEGKEFDYFETVILDDDSENSRKNIKMLELAIQHGEEQRVDYSQIDMAIGAYHDIVETGLLTVDEYAESTNETVNEVKKRIEIAQLIIEFLDFMKVPGQYHIAREMQVYSVFLELVPLLKRCETEESKNELKQCVFNNSMMKSFADQKKYIRGIRTIMDNGFYGSYIKKQNAIAEQIEKKKEVSDIRNKKDLDRFVTENEDLAEDLQIALDRSLLQTKKKQTKSRPSQLVSKSLSSLMDIDTRIIESLSEPEKEKLNTQLKKLGNAVSIIENEVNPEDQVTAEEKKDESGSGRLLLAARHKNEPVVYCLDEDRNITNLIFPLSFGLFRYSDAQDTESRYTAFFVGPDGEKLCRECELCVREGEQTKASFSLKTSTSSLQKCFLILKSCSDGENEARQLIEFSVDIAFNVDVDF